MFDKDDYHNTGIAGGIQDDGHNVSTRNQPVFQAEIANPDLAKLDLRTASYDDIQRERIK